MVFSDVIRRRIGEQSVCGTFLTEEGEVWSVSIFLCTMTIATPFSGAANSVTSAKIVLITGVSKGLGRALSLEMAKRGHTVIGCARTQEKLTALQSELSSPENHLLLTADVVIAALRNSQCLNTFNGNAYIFWIMNWDLFMIADMWMCIFTKMCSYDKTLGD